MTADVPNLIIYGGAFDPPHAGHVDIVRKAIERFPEAQVLVMPAPAPAVAGSDDAKVPYATFEDRSAMAFLAFGPLSRRVAISNLETKLPTPSFTINTLRALKTQHPTSRLGLLVGGDQLASFDRWRAWRDILAIATLIAVARAGVAPTPGFGPMITLEGSPPPAESRKIRAAIADGTTVPDGWLSAAVRQYIEKRRLYAQNEDT